MKKIFITAIGGDIGYGVVKALKNSHHELYIIGCDIQRYNCTYDLVDEFYLSPLYKNTEEWLDFVLKIIKDNSVDYFWPITENEIKITIRNKKLFLLDVIMNEENILNVTLDKEKTASFLHKNGISVPGTWTTAGECTQSFPLIVKEKFGCGSHSVQKINDKHSLNEALKKMESPIIQEYVGSENEEYTMTIFSNGKIVNYIAFRRELGFGGMSRYVELISDKKLKQMAIQITNLFNLKGCINVQMRKDCDTYYIFEINPRISSTIGFREKIGFHDVSWWIDMMEGKTIEQFSYPHKKIFGVRTVEEKLFYEGQG